MRNVLVASDTRWPSLLTIKIHPLPVALNLDLRNRMNFPYGGSLFANYVYVLGVKHQPTADSDLRLRIDQWGEHRSGPPVLWPGAWRGLNDDRATDWLRWGVG